MSALSFEQVTVRYGAGRHRTTVVDAVDLVIPSGTVVGLVGESGSGKSTLAKAAVGLAPVASGRILVNGMPFASKTGPGRPVQMVFQDPYASLNPRMTIGEIVREPMGKAALRGRSAGRAEAVRLLELVNLDPSSAASRPHELSGGQRQRVALARALAARPQVLIADEITSALDVSVQGTTLNLVRDLQRQLQLGLLFISHNLAVVRYVSDFLAVMYLGRIVESGPVDEVLSRPQHPYTRQLLEAIPTRDRAVLTAGSADQPPAPWEVTEPPDQHQPPHGCHFHPRCPIGPLALPERLICRTVDPRDNALAHRNRAACHFAQPREH